MDVVGLVRSKLLRVNGHFSDGNHGIERLLSLSLTDRTDQKAKAKKYYLSQIAQIETKQNKRYLSRIAQITRIKTKKHSTCIFCAIRER
jgi:hypothetical protein